MPGRFSRRRFLGIAGGAAAVVAFAPPPELAWAEAATASRRHDPLSRLGRRYLALNPGEHSVSTLFDRVPELRRSRPVAEQLSSLQATVTADFATAHTVSIDGWRVARTEARVAALHALGR